MSNPTNLQELADSLAAQAVAALQRAQDEHRSAVREGGYRDALLDTRATVLAMIAEYNKLGIGPQDGTSGQDRESYSDDQDRDSYTVDGCEYDEPDPEREGQDRYIADLGL